VTVRILSPDSDEGLLEFIAFQDCIRPELTARWPAPVEMLFPIITGASALAAGKTMKPFVAHADGELKARVLAFVDPAYARRWNEKLGHLAFFEAAPDAHGAARVLLDAACEWLREQGADAARAGFFPPIEMPFVIDEYDALPPNLMRQNPDYYHAFIKDAGFFSEKGLVDYKIRVTDDLVVRYRDALEAGRRAGFEIVPLRDLPPDRRAHEFAPAFNEAFHDHWGYVAAGDRAFAEMLEYFEILGGLETSVIAYREGEVVGTLMAAPEETARAVLKRGRVLDDSERLNFLGIGVRAPARGRGLNLAMASYAYLKLVEKGAKYLSYTLVVDDNWPSRLTARKLGARVCANYVVYRRDFRRRPPAH
jgi:GNAT superfamily N-acetyltransferase